MARHHTYEVLTRLKVEARSGGWSDITAALANRVWPDGIEYAGTPPYDGPTPPHEPASRRPETRRNAIISRMIHALFVVARHSPDETTLAIVTARVPRALGSAERFHDALRAALTRWVTQTRLGRKAWSHTNHDFNVGDLAQWQDQPGLRRYLAARGIHRLRVQTYCSLDAPATWVFDDVLVNQD